MGFTPIDLEDRGNQDMRLEAAIKGDLLKFMKNQQLAAEHAVTTAVTEITQNIKNELRQQVVSAGLGQRLAKTWQAKIFPKGQKSINAVGYITSKAPEIIRAFNDGAIIRSKKGLFLAVPTPAAPKRGIGGKRINPSNFPENIYGRLRFIYRPKGISLLVVDNQRLKGGKRGGFTKASEKHAKNKNLITVVMFLLLPQVLLKKRLYYQSVVNKWLPGLTGSVLKHWNKTG